MGNLQKIGKISEKVEKLAFNVLQHKSDKEGNYYTNAVNSIMQAISVSDSQVIQDEDMVLCEKVDMSSDWKANSKINLLRECIKPGTKVKFTITVNTKLLNENHVLVKNKESFNNMLMKKMEIIQLK